MADTRAYAEAERWVREHGLPARYPGHRFEKLDLSVGMRTTGDPAYHEFDAVSEDRTEVASVKASSGLTTGGKLPVGKTKDAYAELHFLSLVIAPRRLLVLTDPDFYRIFTKVSDGKLPAGAEVVHLPLPPELEQRVRAARTVAFAEVSPGGVPPPENPLPK